MGAGLGGGGKEEEWGASVILSTIKNRNIQLLANWAVFKNEVYLKKNKKT